MVKKLLLFGGNAGDRDQMIQDANDHLFKVQAEGGKYIESHWSIAGPASEDQFLATLLIVYEESGPSMAQANRIARSTSRGSM